MGIATSIYEGEKSLDELSSGEAKTGAMAAIFYGVLVILFLLLSLWKFEVFEKISAR